MDKIRAADLLSLDLRGSGLVFNDSTDYYGFYENGKIIAITGIMWYQNKAIFKNHYVIPARRGRGLFKRMLDYSITEAKSRGIEYIEATCTRYSIKEYLIRGSVILTRYKNGCVKVRLNI